VRTEDHPGFSEFDSNALVLREAMTLRDGPLLQFFCLIVPHHLNYFFHLNNLLIYADHGGTCLQSQHSGGGGRRMGKSRPIWVT
jgi:hypothetical protein